MQPEWARKLDQKSEPLTDVNAGIKLVCGFMAAAVPVGVVGARQVAILLQRHAGAVGVTSAATVLLISLCVLVVAVLVLVGRSFGATKTAATAFPILTLLGCFALTLILEITP